MSAPDAVSEIGTPIFSVLIAAYNQGPYISDTLNSVARQRFDDYEVVIVDDGSTDDTSEKIAAWTEEFGRTHLNRVTVSRTDNQGQSAAFEHGFSLCRGRYIALLDSDDLWLPEKLERVVEAVRRDPGAGMIVHPLYVVDAEGRRTGDVRPMRAKLSEGDLREQVRATARQTAPATTGVVIRADVFAQLVPMPTKAFRSAADAYLTFGASLMAPVRALPDPLGEYRMQPGSYYLKRVTSAAGLRQTVEIQNTIARHFGVEEAARRNSYFARHRFALQKLDAGVGEQLRAYLQLLASTFRDPSFGARDKILFAGFWTAAMISPRPVFARLWTEFQLRHTGYRNMRPPAADPAGKGHDPS